MTGASPCILALDSGGTKTLLLVVDRNANIVSARRGTGSNPFDQPRWREVLAELLADVPAHVAGAAFGLAGYGESVTITARQDAAVHEILGLPTDRYIVRNDVEMACTGAFAGAPGVLILSGTGSMAWAMDETGRNLRVGGWGPLFGDEGSAFWIGREALSLLTQALDGRDGDAHPFIAPMCRSMNLPTSPAAAGAALLEWYGGLSHERSAVAALAHGVCEMAMNGNEQACRILDRAARHLARHVTVARRGLSRPELPWSHTGGTFNNPYLRQAMTRLCGQPQPPRLPPIGGGILRAARQAGWATDAPWTDHLASALKDMKL
ncbi:N-acetylglucosamine kinase [Novacetimonas pomaceti]|uniref:N-acetylglucosamine kinase n=1 Tax=Novacetimonas pomaceti TaxID=2021998 RepID=UPI001C2DD759|nr:BadF/BadG/BcrA/BcrD ATPase family protein [Novacetimonas pomaceti]MBV1833599.1 N-acetylglucosamine kinase [Novacetimonas pomaceti]